MFHHQSDHILQSYSLLTSSGTRPEGTADGDVLHLTDQLPERITSWHRYVVDEHNDVIPFYRGTLKEATIAHGTYDTVAAYAAAVVAALEAADSALVWACDQVSNRFRIRDAAGAPVGFELRWVTGANTHRSAAIDLGFDPTTDYTGADTYTAPHVSYQSRKFIVISRRDGSGDPLPASAAVLYFHSLILGGNANTRSRAVIESNTTNDWTFPVFSREFDYLPLINAKPYRTNRVIACPLYFGETRNEGYWRLTLDDVQNPVGGTGITRIGRFLLGTYITTDYPLSADVTVTTDDFSTGSTGAGGTADMLHQTRTNRDVWSIGWNELDPEASWQLVEFFRSMGACRNFFMDLEPAFETELYYGYYTVPPVRNRILTYTDWRFEFIECAQSYHTRAALIA